MSVREWEWMNESDPDKWNYNDMINKPGLDPYNNKKKLDPFCYNLMKFDMVIMLKEFLKHTNHYLNDDVKEWIIKKALQDSKNDY